METLNLNELKYNEQGLIPVVVQSYETKDVLMLAYMNEEALKQTIQTKMGTYFSRSRQEIWKKGETSGNVQYVKKLTYDCDADTLLLEVTQEGVACHTGEMSCFHHVIFENEEKSESKDLLNQLYQTIAERKKNPVEGSYTNYLFTKGLDKILKKVGEETAEVIIASKNQSAEETIYEISDLVYHTLVLMVNQGITIDAIAAELKSRQQKKR
ncbi:MAG: bifunctional phosphoribosyl-AMP cyclohydrolase/phosphoribosyl-ATP diphosphatase HisIE [Acholeplasma sp.]|jgi:phosphoribosyl-ATP pyrophosphohydrolase/phosphoribosyl-AMP cyclohydrolase|nr:MAG: bifunctional phosphoribosyl-AMP cyclohydrolase/phosphoribosyl-ATP diphosphatase HisIE [Acholeplasma sp.]